MNRGGPPRGTPPWCPPPRSPTLRRCLLLLAALGVILLTCGGIAFVPWVDGGSFYRSVRDGLPPAAAAEGGHRGDRPMGAAPPVLHREDTDEVYLLRDETLYLHTQTYRFALVLVTSVDEVAWTSERIQDLREAHPELEPYWPDPERPDGGVQWVVDNDVPDREPRRP